MRKLLSCLLVVFIGTAATTQTFAENASVDIETNFKEPLKATAQVVSTNVDFSNDSVLPSGNFAFYNSFIRITSFSNFISVNTIGAKKSCAYIYIIKNNLLKALSSEIMFLV